MQTCDVHIKHYHDCVIFSKYNGCMLLDKVVVYTQSLKSNLEI